MKSSHISRLLKVTAWSSLALGSAFTAIVGFAHTAPGKPLLAVMGRAMGMPTAARAGGKCPLGYDVKATPDQKEAARRQFASSHAGTDRAQARPALGFVLDKTTRADITNWATAHDIRCTVPKSGSDLDCSDVPAEALPDGETGIGLHILWFTFGLGDTLTSAIGVRRDASVETVSSTFRRVTDEVSREAGPPATTVGDPSPGMLSSGALYQASAEYRFRNYFALTRATNMGPRQGFVITEEYRSLPDS
jgi:hypothetical protein